MKIISDTLENSLRPYSPRNWQISYLDKLMPGVRYTFASTGGFKNADNHNFNKLIQVPSVKYEPKPYFHYGK